jgi:drug/metabolite transporter (DMT)-like permease
MANGELLGVVSAAAFGCSDFAGGLGARRLNYYWVTALSALVSSSGAWIVVALRGDSPSWVALCWGVLAGTGAVVGATALYRGFARGQMAVAGPLSAVGAAALPAAVGTLLGETLALRGVIGVVLALPAIWLMSSAGSTSDLRSGAVDGLVSGCGFAIEFVGLARSGTGSGLWPIAVSQSTALVLVGLILLRRRSRPDQRRWGRGHLLAGGAGLLSLVATTAYYLAASGGRLTVAAVLASLYPGITVALAALLLRERPARMQVLGMALGAVAVTLVVTA